MIQDFHEDGDTARGFGIVRRACPPISICIFRFLLDMGKKQWPTAKFSQLALRWSQVLGIGAEIYFSRMSRRYAMRSLKSLSETVVSKAAGIRESVEVVRDFTASFRTLTDFPLASVSVINSPCC